MRERRLIRLREHRTTTLSLTSDEFADLAACGARLGLQPRGGDVFDVTAAEVVGAISTPRLHVVIEPKVPIARLLALLTYATTPLEFRTIVAADERRDLLSVMQHLYGSALDNALREGLVHAYEARNDRVHAVRGRIEAKTLALERFGVFPPIDCSFEEHTPDIEVNRRMLAAALLLARHERGSLPARRLLSLASRMTDVAEVAYIPSDVRPLPLDRRFDRIRVALGLAEIVLRNASIELANGVAQSLGFLVDMDRLFEDLVVEGLRACLAPHVWWNRQPAGLHLDEDGRVSIRPDAVARRRKDGRVVLVLDVKYKAAGLAKNQDLYQLVAYSQAIGAPSAALVYATVESERLRIRGGGPNVELHQLDLDCEPEELRARLAALAEKLRILAGF